MDKLELTSRRHLQLFVAFNTMVLRPYCGFSGAAEFPQNQIFFFLHKYSSESVSLPKMLIMTCSHPLSVVYDKRKETWLTIALGYLRGRVSS